MERERFPMVIPDKTKMQLFHNGGYLFHNGMVVHIVGTELGNIPIYDASTVYTPGDYYCYEGQPYMRSFSAKNSSQPDGFFNPKNWVSPPHIYDI